MLVAILVFLYIKVLFISYKYEKKLVNIRRETLAGKGR